MSKTIISEGRTSTEAIEKGLKELGVSKDRVDIKILENDQKKSFFSILSPRIVKVELTTKEINSKEEKKITKEFNILGDKEKELVKENLNLFLDDFSKKIKLSYNIKFDDKYVYVELGDENASSLIGYHGETINALQTILSSVANKNISEKVHLILDIENYREKRKKVLENLSQSIAKKVTETGKQITLEPMTAYERKIIHNHLQNNKKIKTFSIGEEPYRKVVISRK